MSNGLDVLAMREDDVTKLLAAGTHLGDPNVDYQMAQYVYKVKGDGEGAGGGERGRLCKVCRGGGISSECV